MMPNSKPQISILMPVHNAEGTLREAVESCQAQTLGDWELVAIDDRCGDESAAILGQMAAADPRVRIVAASKPGGLVAALNTACAEARGRFWARMDADDRMHPERLRLQWEFLTAHPDIGVVGCGVRIFGSADPAEAAYSTEAATPRDGFGRYERWLNALTTPEAISRERFVESPMVHPSVMLRPSALAAAGLDAAGPYRETRWAEDYDLWLRLLEAGVPFAKLAEVLLDWRDGSGRLTRTDPRYALGQFMAARAHFLARLPAIRSRGVMIAGAGPTGKSLARLLGAEGAAVRAFIDVHPRRHGQRIGGVPVSGIEAIPPAGPGAPVQLAAVGQPGRRRLVVDLFREKGYREGIDCWAVA